MNPLNLLNPLSPLNPMSPLNLVNQTASTDLARHSSCGDSVGSHNSHDSGWSGHNHDSGSSSHSTIPDGLAIAMTADFRAASIAGRAAQGITDFNEAELHVIIQAVEFERRSAAVDQPGTVSG